jgi:ATP adenylyltransferase/5',5'''-P-1,P-4-tetraphosphate phosphorylase II
MQTGSLAWWMAVDRARERAEASGLLAPPATLVPGAWRGSPYLIGWNDEIPARAPLSGGLPVLSPSLSNDGGGSASGTVTHRAELVRQPILRGQLRLVRERLRNRKGLDADDFALLWRCLQGRDALGFFRASAASQSDGRRDLELAPLPLHPLSGLPVASALIQADLRNGFGRVPLWSFPHLLAAVAPDWLAQPERGGRIAWVLYLRMRRALQGKSGAGDCHLLATRRWMWLVPNPASAVLDYAGLMSVHTPAQWEGLMRRGPWASLADGGLGVVSEQEAGLCG